MAFKANRQQLSFYSEPFTTNPLPSHWAHDTAQHREVPSCPGEPGPCSSSDNKTQGLLVQFNNFPFPSGQETLPGSLELQVLQHRWT